MATGRLGVGETLEALNAAVGPGSPVWFKETHTRHLRVRDFLAPRSALQARFRDGQRPAVFEHVLGALASYATPAKPASPGPRVVLHCPALRCNSGTLRLSQLRAVLVADHLVRVLRAHGVRVCSVPPVRDPHMSTFLQKLRVEWPTASKSTSTETLRTCVLANLNGSKEATLPPGVLGRLCLKELVEQRGTAGYDPSIDHCLVTEDVLSVLSELQEAVRHWPEGGHPGPAGRPDAGVDDCVVIHVVSCEEAFQQQKLDLLWQKLDDRAPHKQKHLVCGPVKMAGVPGTQLTAPQYYRLRHAQVCEASALKHGGDLAQDPAWTETFDILSVATIKFEMLSTAPQSQGEWLLLFNSVLPFLDLLSQTVSLAGTPGLHIPVRTEMVCKFLVQLSMDFSSYYNRVHILGEPRPHLFGQMFARLQLLRAVREVFHTGLAMLGLPPLSHI